MNKISGINTAVGTSREDIISAGATLSEPTQARVHALVSNSAEDDADGTNQVETATIVGTIAGILQVETATIVGAIGETGEGNMSVVVIGALVGSSPKTFSVAVANSDTANQVATKVRAALNGSTDITTNYTVGGSGALVTLTTKAVAANDATLNIAYDNDTCSGLTAGPTSANTTAGHAGTGAASIVVTSAICASSPITLSVNVTVGDTASQVATKVRAALNANAEISANYTVGGTGAYVSLTALVAAANDSTLNIASDNGTCNGLTTQASSANTTSGYVGSGAQKVLVEGVGSDGAETSELVSLNGTTSVNTTKSYRYINNLTVKKAGSGGVNAGVITATAATDSTVTNQIAAGKNKSQQAVFMGSFTKKIKNLSISAYNSTSGAYTTVDILKKIPGEVYEPIHTIVLNSDAPNFVDAACDFIPEIVGNTMFKIAATASAGASVVNANFETE